MDVHMGGLKQRTSEHQSRLVINRNVNYTQTVRKDKRCSAVSGAERWLSAVPPWLVAAHNCNAMPSSLKMSSIVADRSLLEE